MLIPRHSVVMSTCELGHIHRELTRPPSHRYSWPHISVQKTELRSNQLADNHIHTQADSAISCLLLQGIILFWPQFPQD